MRTHAAGTGAGRATLPLFTIATFLGATLLFLVEPMVTKMLLPRLGGTPAVWNTAMVFFQMCLLGGYAFAHVSLTKLGTRRQPVLQLAFLVLPLALLPIAVPAGWNPPTDLEPSLWTLAALTVMVGAPFFMLSTAGPTLQRWFSDTGHPRADDPYFLYAGGNIGSLIALVAYPLVIEPTLSLTDQSRLWSVLYVAFVALSLACAITLWRGSRSRQSVSSVPPSAQSSVPSSVHDVLADEDARGGAPAPALDPVIANGTDHRTITWRTRMRWIYLAAIPSALMLGVTRHISTDVASMPLLWVIPLALYLITFIVAFGRRTETSVRISARILKLLVVPLALSLFGLVASIWITFVLHLGVFFCAAMVAHGRLAAERPPPEKLTEFYLLLSTGGMVGGITTALIAPVVFTSVLEYPIAIVLALTVLPASAFVPRSAVVHGRALLLGTRSIEYRTMVLTLVVVVLTIGSVTIRATGSQNALTLSILVAALAAAGAYVIARGAVGFAAVMGALLLIAVLVPSNPTIDSERTFFGVHRVYEDLTNNNRHVLLNGTTVHGMEDYVGDDAHQPTTYYHRTGPIGQYFAAKASDPAQSIGLVGLGTGALAAYGRADDRFTYYEIDQAVIDIARDRDLFTFVPDTKATIDFRLGDGRLELEAAHDARYDLLVIDAFSGDAIPIHLITNEAVALYRTRLSDGGVIAFHISNRYFDFAPILERLASEQNLVGVIQDDPPTPEEQDEGKLQATWVLLAASTDDLAAVTDDPRWTPLGPGVGAPLWTDNYSDLLHVFRW